MKTRRIIEILAIAVVSFSLSANATLIDNGDGTITDDDLGIMWLKTPGPDASWADAVAWADSLVFAGYDDWRLPSAFKFGTTTPDEGVFTFSTDNEFGHLYGAELGNPANSSQTVPLSGYNPLWFWTATPDGNDAYAFFWSFDGIWGIDSLPAGDRLHVTAVRNIAGSGGSNGVPETGSTALLLSIAGISLVAFKRRVSPPESH